MNDKFAGASQFCVKAVLLLAFVVYTVESIPQRLVAVALIGSEKLSRWLVRKSLTLHYMARSMSSGKSIQRS